MKQQQKSYNPWLVCLGTTISVFMTTGIGSNLFTAFQPGLITLRHFTNAQASWVVTARVLFTFLAVLTLEKACRAIGIRRVMVLGDFAFIASCLLFALSESFLLNCVAAVLCGIGIGYGGATALSTLLTSWFTRHRGLAIGLASASTGVAIILLMPLATGIIESRGLRTAFLAEALVGVVLAVPAMLLIREKPQTPCEQTAVESARGREAEQSGKNPALMASFVASFLLGGPCGSGFSHLSVLYETEGWDAMHTSFLISYFGFVLMVAKIILGALCDKLGGKRAGLLSLLFMTLGALLCTAASPERVVTAYLSATLLGFGLTQGTVMLPIFVNDFGGLENFARNNKNIKSIYMFGSMVFTPLPGILADRSGSYIPSFQIFTLLSVAATLLIYYAYAKVEAGSREKAA